MAIELQDSTSMIVRATTAVLLWALALGASAQTVRYIHTDALGSVAVVTDQNRNVVERREYEPYGRQLTPAVKDGPGYTGHVQDAATGLTYMQQRYYDPQVGLLLSVDPVTAYSNPVGQFHRYRYANNNPYKFTDPDGRIAETIWDVANVIMGATSAYNNFSEGNIGAGVVDSLGVVVDVAATAIPVVPGGAGAAIKAARGADSVIDAARGVDKAADTARTVDAAIDGGKSAPDFIVSSGGTAFPVPKGAAGPTPVINPGGKQTGVAFTGGKGGVNGQVSTMRIMDATPARGGSPGYPNGYVKYENAGKQGVDPYSGKTVPNTKSHFPLNK